MPAVPYTGVPSVSPQGNTGLPYQSGAAASPDAFGASVGQAQQGLGQKVEQFGDMLQKHAMKMQEEVNVSNAEQLFLQQTTKASALNESFQTLEGSARAQALPDHLKELQKLREEGMNAATNPDVKKKFDQLFTRRLGYDVENSARLAATATRQSMKETSAAMQANSLESIARNYNDDNRFKEEMEVGKASLRNTFDYRGSTEPVRQQKERELESAAWATRLTVMAKTDPLRAREQLEKNKDSIGAATVFKLEPIIKDGIVNSQSRVEADRLRQEGDLISPNLVERIKKFEGYRDTAYPDGRQTSIGYGTKAQPGDDKIAPDQRKAVFEQRMKDELGKAANIVDAFAPGLPSGTRDALISLTYNSGSAWTSSGLGQKIRAGDFEGAKSNFSDYVNNSATGAADPALIGRRQSELSWWGGEPSTTGELNETKLSRILDRAKENAIQMFPNDPIYQAKYLDTLQNRIKTDNAIAKQAADQMQLQIKTTVQSELNAPPQNGKTRVTDYNQLSLRAQQAYDQAPTAAQQQFQRQMRLNATQDVPETMERKDLATTLGGYARTAPDKFMSLDLTQFDLTHDQRNKLTLMQADRKKLLDQGAKMAPAMGIMKPLLNQAGITSSPNGEPGKYDQFQGAYEQALSAMEQEKKRPLTYTEQHEVGVKLLKQVVTGEGWVRDTRVPAYQAITEKTPVIVKSLDEARGLPSGTTFTFNGETRTRK